MKKNNITVKKGGKESKQVIVNTLNIRPIQRSSADVALWKNAIQSADRGRRRDLLNLYDDLMIDTRLSSVVEKRVLPITNSEWVFTDASGKENDIIKALIDTPAFESILEEAQNTIAYGPVVMELMNDANGQLAVSIIPRKHTRTDKGIIVINDSDEVGIDYRNPPYVNYCLEVGKPDDYGLLFKAAPFVIFKKGNFSDWAQYAEIFGMPMRIGKYDINDLTSKTFLEQSLEGAGSASWMAIPKETDLEIKESKATGDGALYRELKNACNEELTILFLGQTMTTENGSSKAQGQVHLEVEEAIHKKDRRRVRRILNQHLIPILENLGYPVSGGRFDIKDESKLSVKERLDILDQVNAVTPVSDDEYYTVSGVPKPENYDQLKKAKEAVPPPPPTPVPDPKAPKPKKDKKEVKLSWFKEMASFFVKAE